MVRTLDALIGKRSAIVVAHPDDETLWAGGLISKYPWRFDVICCTVPRRDPQRAIRFFEAVRQLRAFPVLIPFVESGPTEDIPHLGQVDLSPYDFIVTHNENGEYGHHHHRQVHRYVSNNTSCRLYSFGFGGGGVTLGLTSDEVETKTKALKCYDHQSPLDNGKPKWQALLDRYQIDLSRELFNVER